MKHKFYFWCFLCISRVGYTQKLTTQIHLFLGTTHELQHIKDEQHNLLPALWSINMDYHCPCGTDVNGVGITQEIKQNYLLEIDYLWHRKFTSVRTDKQYFSLQTSLLSYYAKKINIKIYKNIHLFKNLNVNAGIGYRILWREGKPSEYKSIGFGDNYNEPLDSSLIKEGYKFLNFYLLQTDNNHNSLITGSLNLEYNLKNRINFYTGLTIDYGLKHISDAEIIYGVNKEPNVQAQIWDTGNVMFWTLGTKLPIDWLWRNGYVKELFKK
jgi:hypothetical protein